MTRRIYRTGSGFSGSIGKIHFTALRPELLVSDISEKLLRQEAPERGLFASVNAVWSADPASIAFTSMS